MQCLTLLVVWVSMIALHKVLLRLTKEVPWHMIELEFTFLFTID